MSDGITVTAPDIFQLRQKLGFVYPWIAVRMIGPTDAPTFKIDHDNQTHSFDKPAQAAKHIERILRRVITKAPKLPKPLNGARQKRRAR